MPAAKDLTGLVFHRLTALEKLSTKTSSGYLWKCQCACGNIVCVAAGSLRKGNTKGCGCLHKVVGRPKQHGGTATHGTGTPEYGIWEQMMTRCFVPHHKHFKSYGGRGITVCDRWKLFDNFSEDMGPKPQGFTLERIDNNKCYSGDNCKWATRLEQLSNTRKNRYLEFNGERLHVSEWARRVGLSKSCVLARLHRGIPILQALTMRSRKSPHIASANSAPSKACSNPI